MSKVRNFIGKGVCPLTLYMQNEDFFITKEFMSIYEALDYLGDSMAPKSGTNYYASEISRFKGKIYHQYYKIEYEKDHDMVGAGWKYTPGYEYKTVKKYLEPYKK